MKDIFKRFKERFTAKQRAILCALSVLLMVLLGSVAARAMNNSSSLMLGVPKADVFENTPLIALDSGAKNKVLYGSGTYKFTQKQLAGIEAYLSQYGDGALTVVVSRGGQGDSKGKGASRRDGRGNFSFGLFFDDGRGDTALLPVVTSDMGRSARYRLTLSFGRNEDGRVVIPHGFFAKCQDAVTIEEALITRAAIGYDKSGNTPHFAFASTGGIADMSRNEVDFSGGSSLFPTQNGLLSQTYGSILTNGANSVTRGGVTDPLQETQTYGSILTNGANSVTRGGVSDPLQETQTSGGGTSGRRARVMPKIIVKLQRAGEGKCTLGFGGEKFTLWRYNAPATDPCYTLTCYAASLASPFDVARLEGAQSVALMMVSSEEELSPLSSGGREEVLVPYKTDPGFIITWSSDTWRCRDYELFEWDRFPKVLFMDFRNYEVQSAFLRRLAFFVEKKGYRGRLASDEELMGKHDYNAHDYRAESLAAFYSKAAAEDFPLNDSEMLLRDILIKNGLIKAGDDGYTSSGGALISISKQSEMWRRDRLLAHEGWHGIYFTDERFRNAVAAVYGTMDGESRDFLEQFWGTQEDLNYDTTDAYLTQNEFMAYLMQQRLSDVSSYFVHLANRGSVMRGIPELCQYVRATGGAAFEDAARVLDEYAQDNFGLACGRICLVRK